jgi:hypothetical protein
MRRMRPRPTPPSAPRPLAPRALAALSLAAVAIACVPGKGNVSGPVTGDPAASSASVRVAEAGAALVTTGDAAPAADASRAVAARALVPEGPAKWRTVPREQAGFYTVLDGLCSDLAAGRVGKDIVVHYGGGALGYYTDKRRGDASFIALRDDGLESIGDPTIASPTGIAGRSLDDFWVADSTGTRSSEGAILHRYVGGKWKTYQKDQTNIHAWVDGGVIGSLGMAAANGELWVEGSTTKPPLALYEDYAYPALAAFPTGDVLLVSRRRWQENPDAPLVGRHWTPGGKITEHALQALLPGDAWPSVHEVAPDEVYVVRADRVARWNGSAFSALGKTTKGQPIKQVRRAGLDDLWVLTEAGALERIAKAGGAAIPTPEPVADLDGVEDGAPWLVGKSGKLFRRAGAEWKPVTLPVPTFTSGSTFKAKRVLVASAGDVILVGMYWEKGPGWKDQELHTALFRTRPVKETLRCNEPDPENNNIHVGRGFQSWPPMATADCKTPFAVLARRSNVIKVKDDWPRIRAALKGHAELGEVALVEFVSGDRTFVGAKAKDLDAARQIAKLVAANDRLRPEVVCGDPEPRRTLAIDLATGVASEK